MTTVESKPERVGFTGHQGLTAQTSAIVAAEIDRYLSRLSNFVGVCSLAEGSDQIFAESVLKNNGQLEAVIPCRAYESTFEDSSTLDAYKSFLHASSVIVELDYPEPNENAFWAAGQKVVEQSDSVLAVWDGQHSKGLGGTADVVEYARGLGKVAIVIWPAGSARL